ncbi:hypothetical protein ACLPD8_07355 [Proteus mirabilis]
MKSLSISSNGIPKALASTNLSESIEMTSDNSGGHGLPLLQRSMQNLNIKSN